MAFLSGCVSDYVTISVDDIRKDTQPNLKDRGLYDELGQGEPTYGWWVLSGSEKTGSEST